MKKLVLGMFLLLSLSGCTSVSVRPVEDIGIKHICVKDCKEMCFDDRMLDIIQDGFQRHGITATTVTEESMLGCEHTLTYYCERTWDFATYLHHAEIRVYHDKAQIGYAEYHLTGKGGLSLMKWESSKPKMEPIIDQLLVNYSIQEAFKKNE